MDFGELFEENIVPKKTPSIPKSKPKKTVSKKNTKSAKKIIFPRNSDDYIKNVIAVDSKYKNSSNIKYSLVTMELLLKLYDRKGKTIFHIGQNICNIDRKTKCVYINYKKHPTKKLITMIDNDFDNKMFQIEANDTSIISKFFGTSINILSIDFVKDNHGNLVIQDNNTLTINKIIYSLSSNYNVDIDQILLALEYEYELPSRYYNTNVYVEITHPVLTKEQTEQVLHLVNLIQNIPTIDVYFDHILHYQYMSSSIDNGKIKVSGVIHKDTPYEDKIIEFMESQMYSIGEFIVPIKNHNYNVGIQIKDINKIIMLLHVPDRLYNCLKSKSMTKLVMADRNEYLGIINRSSFENNTYIVKQIQKLLETTKVNCLLVKNIHRSKSDPSDVSIDYDLKTINTYKELYSLMTKEYISFIYMYTQVTDTEDPYDATMPTVYIPKKHIHSTGMPVFQTAKEVIDTFPSELNTLYISFKTVSNRLKDSNSIHTVNSFIRKQDIEDEFCIQEINWLNHIASNIPNMNDDSE